MFSAFQNQLGYYYINISLREEILNEILNRRRQTPRDMKQSIGIIDYPRLGLARAPASARSAATMPFVLTLVLIGMFLPEELSFFLFGLRLTVVRLIYLLLAPILLV